MTLKKKYSMLNVQCSIIEYGALVRLLIPNVGGILRLCAPLRLREKQKFTAFGWQLNFTQGREEAKSQISGNGAFKSITSKENIQYSMFNSQCSFIIEH
jgi:hypothetical protein